jgi:hypothetical protein
MPVLEEKPETQHPLSIKDAREAFAHNPNIQNVLSKSWKSIPKEAKENLETLTPVLSNLLREHEEKQSQPSWER